MHGSSGDRRRSALGVPPRRRLTRHDLSPPIEPECPDAHAEKDARPSPDLVTGWMSVTPSPAAR